MLVVTIIIAAIVSGFAGGLAGSQQKAPQASFDIKTQYPVVTNGVGYETTGFDLFFTHKGGDTINSKDTQIITWLTLPNGTVVKHTQTPTSVAARTSGTGATAKYTRFPYFRDSMLSASQSLTAAQIAAGQESPVWWGQVSISTGQAVRVSTKSGVAAFLGLIDSTKVYPYDATAYNDGIELLNQSITNKTKLDVKWLDIPSQKYIFEKSIQMEG